MAMPAPPIRLLTFDLDDTLWELRPVLEVAERVTWEWLVEQAPALAGRWSAERLRELRLQMMQQAPATAHQITRLRQDSVAHALRDAEMAPVEASAVAAAALEIFLEARHRVTLFDQAEAVLEALAGRYQLAAISNGNACVQRLGLGRFFDFAIQAETLARAKPHPEPFEAALARAGCPPAAAIHIGDHCEQDIGAAQALGMGTIWVNRLGAPWPGSEPPLATIRSIAELPPVVAALDAARRPV